MNKKLWSYYSSELPCPNCGEGVLEDYKKDEVSETLSSKIDNEFHKNGLVFPYTTCLCTGHLKCTNCGDVVVMTYIKVDDVRHQDEEGNEIADITPLSYYPPPKIIHIPESCPKEIKTILTQSFGLFWTDLGSCANKVRIAIEALMDHYQINKQLKLHNRIAAFASINIKVSNYLLAIKWIGNSGSHYSEVTKAAILDAYELLEYSLELLFNDRERHLDNLSAKLIAHADINKDFTDKKAPFLIVQYVLFILIKYTFLRRDSETNILRLLTDFMWFKCPSNHSY